MVDTPGSTFPSLHDKTLSQESFRLMVLATNAARHSSALGRLFSRLIAATKGSGPVAAPAEPSPDTQPALAPPPPPRSHGPERLAELLPILRCPETGLALKVMSLSELMTVDGSRHWPVVSGRPCLFPGLGPPVNHGDHLSNEICAGAQAVIDAADGLVLNLSAGGTPRWNPRVVEAEAAIFRNTDLLADVHALPFSDGAFSAVVALNAFEHYRNPFQAAREIARVLRPGGTLFVHTAFLQPLHEPPWHFYNATRYGVLEWFSDFHTDHLGVSDNFNPVHTLAWFASEVERMVRSNLAPQDADRLLNASLADYARLWTDRSRGDSPIWQAFFQLPTEAQEPLAAGFEFIGRRR
jgi:SAM-dependent methyltransferase